jgi:hypothetical protein
VKYPLLLLEFNETSILSTDFRKKAQISSFIKIRPVGAELCRTNGQTDMTKLIVAFRNFANEPKIHACFFFPYLESGGFRATEGLITVLPLSVYSISFFLKVIQ